MSCNDISIDPGEGEGFKVQFEGDSCFRPCIKLNRYDGQTQHEQNVECKSVVTQTNI